MGPGGHGKGLGEGALKRTGGFLITLGLLVILVPFAVTLAGNALRQQQEGEDVARWVREAAPPARSVQTRETPPIAVPFLLEIPRIGLRWMIDEGTEIGDLQRHGAGHIAGTALPGRPGVVGIAGHRTTYGAPFYRLNQLRAGDAVIIRAPSGRLVYRVYRHTQVPPTRGDILRPTSADALLVLISCSPPYSARYRLAVFARLDATATMASDRRKERD